MFYESQPEELPWIRTECVIDVVQAGFGEEDLGGQLEELVRKR